MLLNDLDRLGRALDPQSATDRSERGSDLPLLPWAVARTRTVLLVLLLTTACDSSRNLPPAPSPSRTPTATPPAASPTPADDPLSPRPAIESPAPLGQPTCDPATVTVTDADAVITDRVRAVYVLRTAGRPCQLQGFPDVQLLDEQGRDLRVRTTRTGDVPRPVTLSAGTSLSFSLTTDRDGTCRQAAALRVTLPGTRGPLSATTDLRACGVVEIGPVGRLEDDEDEAAHE